MTVSVSTQVSPVGTKLIKDTDAGATASTDVTGTSGSIFMIDVDNTANVADAAYLKIYDAASPTVGTTVPDFVLKVPANQRRAMVAPDGLDFSALSYAVVTAGGTSGTTAPSSTVTLSMVTS